MSERSIELHEWLDVVQHDPDLQLVDEAKATSPDGQLIRMPSRGGLASWRGTIAFDHWNGNVIVKNPDREAIAKMTALARQLGARVQGDDGEFYDTRGQT